MTDKTQGGVADPSMPAKSFSRYWNRHLKTFQISFLVILSIVTSNFITSNDFNKIESTYQVFWIGLIIFNLISILYMCWTAYDEMCGTVAEELKVFNRQRETEYISRKEREIRQQREEQEAKEALDFIPEFKTLMMKSIFEMWEEFGKAKTEAYYMRKIIDGLDRTKVSAKASADDLIFWIARYLYVPIKPENIGLNVLGLLDYTAFGNNSYDTIEKNILDNLERLTLQYCGSKYLVFNVQDLTENNTVIKTVIMIDIVTGEVLYGCWIEPISKHKDHIRDGVNTYIPVKRGDGRNIGPIEFIAQDVGQMHLVNQMIAKAMDHKGVGSWEKDFKIFTTGEQDDRPS